MLNIPFAIVDDVFLAGARLFGTAKGGHKGPFSGAAGFGMFDIALSSAMAPHGRMVSHALGAFTGFSASTVAMYYGSQAGKLTSYATKRALVGSIGTKASRMLLGGAGGIVGIAATLAVDTLVRGATTKAFNAIQAEAKQMRHINAGGTYVDTQAALTQRQRAAQEISTSLLNARQYLGRESALMHQ